MLTGSITDREHFASTKNAFHTSYAKRPVPALWLEAQDLRGVELIGRRRMLQKAFRKAGPALRFSEHMEGADGEAMFRHA